MTRSESQGRPVVSAEQSVDAVGDPVRRPPEQPRAPQGDDYRPDGVEHEVGHDADT